MSPSRVLRSGAGLRAIGTSLLVLTACGGSPQAPTATSVCDLSAHAQELVQVEADISVDSSGRAVLGDAHCATTKVELRLSETATRNGVAERLTAASQNAAHSGHATLPATVTGVFWNASGSYFVAESISGI
jgi:hypothetical protein